MAEDEETLQLRVRTVSLSPPLPWRVRTAYRRGPSRPADGGSDVLTSTAAQVAGCRPFMLPPHVG